MAQTQTKGFSISPAFEYFWKFEDKTQRTLYIGGVTIAMALIYFLMVFVNVIPFIGPIISLFGYVLLGVGAFIVYAYLRAYRYEISEALADKKVVAKVRLLEDYGRRLRVGSKFLLAKFIYNIPWVVIMVGTLIGLGLTLGLFAEGYSSQSSASQAGTTIALVILFIAVFFVLGVIMALYNSMIELALTRQYYKEHSFSSLLEVSEVWESIQNNFVAMLVYSAMEFVLHLALSAVLFVCYVLAFLCVGILLIPVAYALHQTYRLYVLGHLEGQFIAFDKKD